MLCFFLVIWHHKPCLKRGFVPVLIKVLCCVPLREVRSASSGVEIACFFRTFQRLTARINKTRPLGRLQLSAPRPKHNTTRNQNKSLFLLFTFRTPAPRLSHLQAVWTFAAQLHKFSVLPFALRLCEARPSLKCAFWQLRLLVVSCVHL